MRIEFLDPAKRKLAEAVAFTDIRIRGKAGYLHNSP